MLIKKLGTVLIILFLFTKISYSQEAVLTLNPWDGNPDNQLNAQIAADTVTNGGFLSNRVYELLRDQVYFFNQTINIPEGSTINLRASEGSVKSL